MKRLIASRRGTAVLRPAVAARRRQLVAVAAIAPLALGVFASTARAEALRVPPDSPEHAPLRSVLGDDGLRILWHAALAPSGHNAQPWRVEVVERMHWKIGTRREHWLPAVDPANRETLLSIGAFVENLVVAAGALGYAVDYDVIGTAPTDPLLVDLRLRKAAAIDYPLSRLPSRRTLRTGYVDDLLRREDLLAVTGGTPEFAYFARDSRPARYLAEATIDANRRQAYREPAQQELADWIRWSKTDQERLRNGLTPAGMEIGGLAGWYVGAFYDRAEVLKAGFREAGIKQVVERVTQGAGWLVMTGPTSVAGLIETGRRFERMWLALRERSIAIHPMTQVLEEAPDSATVARELGIDGVPQFVLRIGYVWTYPDPVSPRMPVPWFTRKA
jgi:hypothetical protein